MWEHEESPIPTTQLLQQIQQGETVLPRGVNPKIPQGKETPQRQLTRQVTRPNTQSLAPDDTPGFTLTFTPMEHLDSLPEAGRLKFCLAKWKQITSDPWVKQVAAGCPLELVAKPPQAIRICWTPGQNGLGGDPQARGKVGNQTSRTKARSIHQPGIPCPKEGRIPAPCYKPETLEP